MRAFAQKIIEQRGGGIRLIKAMEDDMPCWFYLKVDEAKLDDYKQKLNEDSMDMRDFGEILESGWGDYPSEDVVRFMKKEYDFDSPKNEE